MRWPWQSAPGMVRVGHRELIGLQRETLSAMERERELTMEIREFRRERQLAEAEAQAYRLLQDRCHVLSDAATRSVCSEVLTELPLTAEGRLHEAAFLALVDARVWAHREREVVAVMATGHFDDGGDAR